MSALTLDRVRDGDWTRWLRDNGVYVAVVGLVLFNAVATSNFMTVDNFRTQLVRVLGTIAGALLMQLIDATLIKHNISDSWSQMAQAVIILAAVYVQLGRRGSGS